MILLVTATGSVVSLYSDDLSDLAALGTAETRRASHVEPSLDGGWSADMGPVGGPVIVGPDGHPFRLRREALAAERAYLDRMLQAGTVPGGVGGSS